MKKSSLPSRRQPLARSKKRIAKRPRSKSEFARIYGSKARVEWVKSLPCVGCGSTQYIENAHIEAGGTGYKAGFAKIVPLCGNRFWRTEKTSNFAYGCHQLLHGMGRESFEKYRGIDLEMLAAHTEQAWQVYSGTSSKDEA